MMSKSIKLLKWFGILIFILIALAVGSYAYLLLSFDDQTLPENHGKVNAELFLGDGDNQPLIVGLGGSEGGNAWASDVWKKQRDTFIAQGYSFLAVAYFGEQGTPANLDRIALEGVHEAIREAAKNPKINSECVALIGGSKGAELALLLGSHYSDIDAVVAIVPGNAVYPALTVAMNTPSFTLNGESMPFVPIPSSATWPLIKGDLRAVYEEMLKDQKAVDRASIEVEKINGPVLFLSATKDEFWPSAEMSGAMDQRLKKNGFPYHFEHLAIEGGHAAPLDHFDVVERFLTDHFLKGDSAGCSKSP
jgi:dienelactone hydrolase